MKRHTFIGCFACALGISTWSHGQATPTAARVGSIQAGAGVMFTRPDYAQTYLKGVTFYGDYDFNNLGILKNHLGIEAEIHYSAITPQDISENTYLFGPRYTWRYKKLGIYGKALFGVGRFGFQQGSYANPQTGTYFAYGLGGGVEYKVTHKINIRGFDAEFQSWPGFPPHGLSPIVYTVGVAYVFR
ncbi:MAG TPA: outer membrane beta-barrel protein [Edaphobacter sp.]|nr:outer membrane beta-barrel protein [Edaphobacter sp.]